MVLSSFHGDDFATDFNVGGGGGRMAGHLRIIMSNRGGLFKHEREDH